MIESEWLASSDPQAMLEHLMRNCTPGYRGVRDRKLKLFCCACCRASEDPGDRPLPSWVREWEDEDDGDPHGVDLARAAESWCDPEYHDSRSKLLMSNVLREIVGNPFLPVKLPYTSYWAVVTGAASVIGCPWLTADVLSLARAAYEERTLPRSELDPLRLAILADALEEAGCAGERCKECHGSGTYTVQARNAALSAANGYGAATTYSEWRGCRHCGGDHDTKGTGHVPHPLLAHLRSPGPHVRGCWALDLILGKE